MRWVTGVWWRYVPLRQWRYCLSFCITCLVNIISSNTEVVFTKHNLGVVSFTLAVLCIPVFDTLRVMGMRIMRGKSPFSPDKTHLHHLFIELGYSHIGTTLSIIGINLFVVLCWFLAYVNDLSIDMQLYIVIALSVFVTFVFYPFVKAQIRRNTVVYHWLQQIGRSTHGQNKHFWRTVQQYMDRSVIKKL